MAHGLACDEPGNVDPAPSLPAAYGDAEYLPS